LGAGRILHFGFKHLLQQFFHQRAENLMGITEFLAGYITALSTGPGMPAFSF